VGWRGQLTQLRASKNEFAEGHSRGPRTAGLDVIFLEPVCVEFSCSPFSCSLLHWSIFGSWHVMITSPDLQVNIFEVHRGFPVVRDYWSGKRRDPIATANSVRSIVESSWFLEKVDFTRIVGLLWHYLKKILRIRILRRVENRETFSGSKFSPATGVRQMMASALRFLVVKKIDCGN